MLAPPRPTQACSISSRPRATRQPSFSSPSRLAAGTTTSVKNSSQNSAPPSICLIRRISMPGDFRSMMRTEMPLCFGTSHRVRTGHIAKSERWALLLQVFWPFTMNESPSRVALVSRPARSDPPLGSEKNCSQSSLPGEDVGDVPELLLVGAEFDQCGAQDVDRHSEVRRRHVVPGRLLVEHPLVLERQPLAPVLDRERESGVAGVEDLLLERLELLEALRPLVGEFLGV